MSHSFDVICFGDINLDYIGKMDRLPKQDEELPIYDLEKFCGGAATNVAVALSRLGNKTAYIGGIGADNIGTELVDELANEGVDVSQVITKPESLSGMVIVVIDDQGERRMITYPGANKEVTGKEINESFIKQAKVLHISSSYLATVSKLVNIAKKHNLLVSFDPGTLASRKGLEGLKKILAKVDILFLNRVEYKQLTGSADKEKLDLFFDLGCQMAIYKEGKKGSYIKTKETSGFFAPGFSVNAVDSTGAGDAFAGGFLSAYLDGLDLKESMIFANAVGAISVTQKGAKAALPSKEIVEQFIKSHK